MPVGRTGEVHRALEHLEEYHASLVNSNSYELKEQVGRLINYFKAALFNSLIEIQNLYEDTLLDERKSVTQKTLETRRLVDLWEKNPPLGRITKEAPLASADSSFRYLDQITNQPSSYVNGNDPSLSSYSYRSEQRREYMTNDGGWKTSQTITQTTPSGQIITTTRDGLIDNDGTEWELEEVVLEKGNTGLGFSIAGGLDQPMPNGDPSIYVTKIIAGGAAAADGRMRQDDIILKVNSTDCSNAPHAVTVDALRNAGNVVRLVLKRRKPKRQISGISSYHSGSCLSPLDHSSPSAPTYPPPAPPSHSSYTNIPIQRNRDIERLERIPGVQKIELYKRQKGLGFSIAGGVNNEHYVGDTGIYVTKIIEGGAAYQDGRLQYGDKLLAVDDISLENVPHDFAVETLKNTSNKVTLLYLKNPHPEVMPIGTLDETAHSLGANSFHQPVGASLSRESLGARTPVSYQATTPQEIPLVPRNVVLHKGPQGLGFNIVGGEEGEPVYISYVLTGGAADLSGNVKRGDALLQVNGVNLRNATHAEAAQALKEAANPVTLTLQYRPQEYVMEVRLFLLDYAEFEAKIEQLRRDLINGTAMPIGGIPRRELYVKALFDYDPARDAGVPHRVLPFYYGDILHVLSSTDDDWWQARAVVENGEEGREGLIPSKKRVEKKERQRRKQVNFNSGSQSLGRNAGMEGRRGSRSQLSFSRKFPFFKSTEKLNEFTDNDHGGTTFTSCTTSDSEYFGINEASIPTYVVVERQQINYPRPVIVLGAMKDRVNDELVLRDHDRFSSCVPHTSRPPKEHEIDGRDYHFVSKEQMQEDVRNNRFIEAGEYMNNLYGTSINAIMDVANTGKHCVLDLRSGNAIRRLQTSANIYPIAIFLKPQNYHQIMDWDRAISEEDAINQYQYWQKVEQNYSDLFTAVIGGQSLEDLVRKSLNVISDQSRSSAWVPSQNQII
uniref:PDZ domain-containing protein n=1 Tax=Syphacia muris TaxID=451379 RepID=A0A0N5B009_9BILA